MIPNLYLQDIGALLAMETYTWCHKYVSRESLSSIISFASVIPLKFPETDPVPAVHSLSVLCWVCDMDQAASLFPLQTKDHDR